MFIVSGVMYAAMFFVTNVWMNIALFVVALASVACASVALWSIYVPSLAKAERYQVQTAFSTAQLTLLLP